MTRRKPPDGPSIRPTLSPDEAGRLGDRVLALEERVETLRAAMHRAADALGDIAARLGVAAAEARAADIGRDLGRLEGIASALATLASDAAGLLHDPLPDLGDVATSKR